MKFKECIDCTYQRDAVMCDYCDDAELYEPITTHDMGFKEEFDDYLDFNPTEDFGE